MEPQQAERLRAFWKKGRDHYRSFFCELDLVRKEIGDKKLPSWCLNNLHLGMATIDNARKLIGGIDAENIKRDFAKAKEAEKAQRQAEKAQRDRDAAAKRSQEREQRFTAKEHRQRHQQQQQQHRKGEDRAKHPGVLAQLLEMWFSADKRCSAAIENWVEGSIQKAKTLCAIRAALPADQDFGAWVDQHKLGLSKDDRAALIGLGYLDEDTLRDILTKSESRSYRVIWRDHRPLKLVKDA